MNGKSVAEVGVCEHGCDKKTPAGRRFCSGECARCEYESESEGGCDGKDRRTQEKSS